ncbi:DUF1298 domain-containing protein [Actinomadura barringtoniae]|uniref:diacylglycerol O-acyltransferase n=1 Tax=Actinomadura barringtoniae TaxID=1427535 RepID=A0A939PKQ3_9ACTN|nr:wax ester/triacylglycerol synthase domain-containing protein [Actinomadura barringtoniae]MBO2450949.1 DUF1298 domain-containing protein [Actinomadura barringtoniae]
MRPADHFGVGAWNLPRRLNTLDTLMWRCEADPVLRAPLVLLALLDDTPDWDRFVAGHEWATRMIPRLRDRPRTFPLLPAAPVWTSVPDFDVADHVRRAALPGDAGRRELLDLVQSMATAPWRPGRPLWESVLVEGLRWDGKPCPAAWILRFHHSMADGQTAAFWLSTLLNRQREPRTGKPDPPPPPPPVSDLLALLEPPPELDLLRRGLIEGKAALDSAEPASASLLKVVRGAVELTPTPVGTPSPLLSGRGLSRRLDLMDVPLDGLRAAAREEGASVNDAFLTGMLVGFRRYHERRGSTPDTLSIAMPLPRKKTSPRVGNGFGVVRLPAPMAVPKEGTHLAAVRDRLAEVTSAYTPAALEVASTVVNALPTPLTLEAMRRLGRSYDVQLSHVAGIHRRFYVSGAAIEGVYCFGPAPGCAAMAVMVSGRGGATLGLTTDPAAVTDGPAFMECLEEGFAEVVGG